MNKQDRKDLMLTMGRELGLTELDFLDIASASLPKPSVKQNWFNSLHDCLASEGLGHTWSDNYEAVNYDETFRYYYNPAGDAASNFNSTNKTIVVIIYRNGEGMYERPVHYSTS